MHFALLDLSFSTVQLLELLGLIEITWLVLLGPGWLLGSIGSGAWGLSRCRCWWLSKGLDLIWYSSELIQSLTDYCLEGLVKLWSFSQTRGPMTWLHRQLSCSAHCSGSIFECLMTRKALAAKDWLWSWLPVWTCFTCGRPLTPILSSWLLLAPCEVMP